MTKEYAEVLADLDDLDKRRSQIEPLAETAEDSEIEERSRLIADMESRYESLLRRKSELEAEERAAEQAAAGRGKVITTPREEERKTMDIASAEYRDAFYANLMGAQRMSSAPRLLRLRIMPSRSRKRWMTRSGITFTRYIRF